MKIAVGASPTTSNIQSNSSSFKIQASGKAFKVLSSSLYNYKILAVVREISCNARDAHAMVKTLDKPFLVKLPCMEDLHFTVRDYGPGLSPEDVMGMYTTYFSSTKMNDNDAIGGFGLGSKSPLSYSTSFQVVSYHGGLKTTFLAFQNDNGEPDIYQLSQHATEEHTGLEVIVPVNEQDIRKFRASAENVYRFFAVAPTLMMGKRTLTEKEFFNYTLEEKLERTVVYEGTKAGRFYNNINTVSEVSNGPVWAQMGDVVYPVTISAVFDTSKQDEAVITRFFERSNYGRLIIDCQIGELDLNAGREGLSYDRATIGRLKTILSLIHGKLVAEANIEIEKCSHYDQALKHSTKFTQFFGQDATYGMFKWRGKKVDFRTVASFPTMEKEHVEWKTFVDKLVDIGEGDGMRYALTSSMRGDFTVRQITGANVGRLGPSPTKDMHFIIVDESTTGSKGTLRDRIEKKFTATKILHGEVNVVVLKVSRLVLNASKGTESASCLYRGLSKQIDVVRKLAAEQTFVKNVHLLSDLPHAEVKVAVAATSSSNGIRREVQEMYLIPVYYSSKKDHAIHLFRAQNMATEEFEATPTEKKFYLVGNKTKITFAGIETNTSRTQYANYWDTYAAGASDTDLLHAWAQYHSAQVKKQFNVYFLNEKQAEEVAKSPNWIRVEDQILVDFAAVIKSVGKYGALKLDTPALDCAELFKALKQQKDFAERIKEWGEFCGQRNNQGAFASSRSFGNAMFNAFANELKDNWKEFSKNAAIDTSLYPTYDAWMKVFRSGKTIYFKSYIQTISPLIASININTWRVAEGWNTEVGLYWDSITTKPSVTQYLEQFFTGK